MKKSHWWIYFLVAFLVSFYTQLHAIKLSNFVYGSFVTFLLFVGIYFCLKNISSSKKILQVARYICVMIFILLVFAFWAFTSYSGFNSSYCYNLVAKNVFTGQIKVYCNVPPWHTQIIGGEEARKILLKDCLKRKAQYYDENPNYCDVYKNSLIENNWTTGPNP